MEDQRRRRTRHSRWWFIISSGGAHSFWPWKYVLYDVCIIWYYLDIELQDCNASFVHFFVIWITVLLLVLWRITRWTLVSGISTTRLVLGVISAMVEKELGKGTLALTRWSTWTETCRRLPRGTIARQRAAGSKQQAARSSVYFRLMWKWKNQRRRRTWRSRLRFLISSGSAHSFFP